MEIVIKAVKHHRTIQNILIKQGSIKIREIPHELRYIGSGVEVKETQKFSLGLIFSTKPTHYVTIKQKKIEIMSDKYISKEVNWKQYHTPAFVDQHLISSNKATIVKFQEQLLKKNIISNMALSCLSHKENIEFFTKKGIQIEQIENSKNLLFMDTITKPRIFSLLNAGTQYYLSSLHEIQKTTTLAEIDTLRQAFIWLSDLNTLNYEKLLNTIDDTELEGLIKIHCRDFFSNIS